MKQEEASKFIGKKVRLILTNRYRYSGMVLDCNDQDLILKDKFQKKVFIKLASIMLFEEVEDGD